MNRRIYLIGPTESILTKRGNRFPNIADFLIENDQKVIYITADYYHAEKRFFTKKEIRLVKNKCKYELNIIKVIGYKRNISIRRVISNFLFSILVFVKLIGKVNKSDIIIIPSRPVELIFFISLISRIKGAKIFIDIQDIWPDALKIQNQVKSKIFTFYCNLFLYPSLKYYTNSFHVAPSFVKWLMRYAPSAPSNFIPLGWENKRWASIEFTNREEVKIIQLVCIAQLQHQIDIMPVLEVLNSNKFIHLTIIGEDGTGERYKEVIKFIQENNIKNIDIIGKTERSEVIELLRNKDIGILPMITSSIPNKIFDYIASYLPIIVLGDNDSSDFVQENKIGWSCDYNSNDFSNLIKNISEEDIKVMKENLQIVRNKYSRDELQKEILKVII